MKKIDMLLQVVRCRMIEKIAASLMMDEGEFITALGLDPEQYAVTLADGTRGYDGLQALNDCAAADWSMDQAEDEEQGRQEEPPRPASTPDRYEVLDVMTLEDAATARLCLTCDETEQILKRIPVIIKGEARHITIEELDKLMTMGKAKPVTKTIDVLGWG